MSDTKPIGAPPESSERLRVRLVLNDRGWIMEKITRRLAENLPEWNVDATIDTQPSMHADINHWMLYGDMRGQLHGKTTMLITHVDRWLKTYLVKQRLQRMDLGICLSRMTLEQLVLCGAPRDKLCYITPAHDGLVKPKRIVIGITSQIRPDGAKREHVLVEMAHSIRLDLFHFEIIGPRWEGVISHLEAAGATVRYSSGADNNAGYVNLVHERLATFDYYLYMGWDEGSMGLLDALAAGIPTIVTPQGFHLDIPDGITHPFATAAELADILRDLAAQRQRRIDGVSGLTWKEYARQHALVWRALVGQRRSEISDLLHSQDAPAPPLPDLTHGELPMNAVRPYFRSRSSALWDDLLLLWEYHATYTPLLRWVRAAKRALAK